MTRMRSLLFVPGDSEKKLAKSENVPADVLILDLEDSVTTSNKQKARDLVVEYLGGRGRRNQPQVWVRINPLENVESGADLSAVIPASPTGIVLPKPRSPEDMEILGRRIGEYEAEYDLQVGSIHIIPVATETPHSIFSLGDYHQCGDRLAALTWGAEDLSAAVGATTNRDGQGDWTAPYQLVRSLCLFAAHAAGVAAIDTLFADFRNARGLERSCIEARRDGFSGKLAIHPDQVEPINQAFTPTRDEIQHARQVVALFEASPGIGTLALDGVMLDLPHLVQAKKILLVAEGDTE